MGVWVWNFGRRAAPGGARALEANFALEPNGAAFNPRVIAKLRHPTQTSADAATPCRAAAAVGACGQRRQSISGEGRWAGDGGVGMSTVAEIRSVKREGEGAAMEGGTDGREGRGCLDGM